jgi:pyruvate dehydrogenase (quinone)/pyruvate oxidase
MPSRRDPARKAVRRLPEDPANCGRILDQALATPGPTVAEAVVNSHEPPMPAKVTFDQAKRFTRSLASGTSDCAKIALRALAKAVRELI